MKTLTKLFATAAAFATLSVSAMPTVYTSEGDFLAAAGAVNLESFESETATNSFTGNSVALTDLTITADGSDNVGIWNEDFVGGFATDGVNWLGNQSGADENLVLTFNDEISIFGINITDWGDFGSGSLVFSNDAGDVFTIAMTPVDNLGELFFGIIGDMGFNTVTLTNGIAGEFYGIDEIYYGNAAAVSAPGSLGLIGLMLVALAAARRNRK